MTPVEPQAEIGASAETDVLLHWGDVVTDAASAGRGLSHRVQDLIRGVPGVATVCDLGCGSGYLASRLGAAGYRVVGVDASDRLLAVANEHYGSDRVRFQRGLLGPATVEALRAEGLFDLVVSVDVIEHLYRPASLIETADAILKPGGILVIGTPYHGYLKNLAIAALDRWDEHHSVHFDGGHIKFFSVASLNRMVATRFDVQRYEYYGRFPGFWKNMICVARKRA